MINVDLGSGKQPKKGYIGIDKRDFGQEYTLDITTSILPFGNDTVDIVRASHLLEHLEPDELFFLVEEVWRVLKPTGHFYIKVPDARTNAYFINPDHKRMFIDDTFGFFQVPAEGIDRHGYLKHFWHVEMLERVNPEEIRVRMHPNKEGGAYPYVTIAKDQ